MWVKPLVHNALELLNAHVCSDALHCQHETVRAVARSNGESLVQIKDDQKGLLGNARAVVRARFPVASKKKVESGHGRREARLTRIFRLDAPAQLGMFGMHTIVQTKCQWEHLSGPNKGKRTDVETSYHASTIEIDERHGVDFFAGAVRSEWAIETGYHGKRNFAYCEDVRTRRCKANIIGAMMLARTPAFVFMAKRGVTNSQVFKEELQSDHAISLRMLVDEPPN